jgi:chemotaxis protein CheD
MGEISVRMGEMAVSADPAVVLVSIGLGSCIGLALVDAAAGVCGLAHIMLPGPGDLERRAASTFADTGVPALLSEVKSLGARRVSGVIVGGAQMFGAGGAGKLQVGTRNEEAVRAAMRAANIPIVAAETGGGSGRTIRVYVDDARVTARIAGGTEADLYGAGKLAVAA